MGAFSDKINVKLPSMTKSLRIVADYYLCNLNTLAFCTLDQTARNIGVSTTTVIRFARELNFSGFSEMQKEIQEELLNKMSLPERLDSLQHTVDKENHLLIDSMQTELNNITETFSGISSETLDSVVEKINSARIVYILGMRGSYALAHYMTSRLGQIRPHIRMIDSNGMLFPEEFCGYNENDLCIAFTFPRHSTTTINLLAWLKRKNIPIILFTTENNSSVKDYADIILPCHVSSVSFKNSIVAPIALINYISAATAVVGRSTAIETIKDTEDFLNLGYYVKKQ